MYVTDILHCMKVFFLGLDLSLYRDKNRWRPEFETGFFVGQLNHQPVINDLLTAPRNLSVLARQFKIFSNFFIVRFPQQHLV